MTSFRCLLRPPSTAIDSRWCIKFLHPRQCLGTQINYPLCFFRAKVPSTNPLNVNINLSEGEMAKHRRVANGILRRVWEYSFFACNMLKLPARVNKCDSAGWKLKLNETLAMFAMWTLPLRQLPSEKKAHAMNVAKRIYISTLNVLCTKSDFHKYIWHLKV